MRDINPIPNVSIVIPTYNSGTDVYNAVRSALAQTWPVREIIVVDDGSTDGTGDILSPLLERIEYIYQSNKGRSAARNRGIEMANGDYIAFLDADDIWFPTKLERQITFLRSYPLAHWAYCKVLLVDGQGEPFESDFWPKCFGSGRTGAHSVLVDLLIGGFEISTSTVLVKRNLLMEVGLFDESLEAAEDTNLWIRLAKVSPLLFQPEVLGTRQINTEKTFRERISAYKYAKYGLRALKNSLVSIGLDPEVDLLARKALYRRLIDSAFIEFDSGNLDIAMDYWQKSQALSKYIDSFDKLATQLVYFALSAARYHRDGLIHAESIFANLIERLPLETSERKKVRKLARSELFAAASFMYKENEHISLASHYARRSLVSGTYNWHNRGLWKQAVYFL